MTVADTYVAFTPEEFHEIFNNIEYITINNKVYFREDVWLNGCHWTDFQAIKGAARYTFNTVALEEPVIYFRDTHEFQLTGAPKFPKFRILDVKKFDHI